MLGLVGGVLGGDHRNRASTTASTQPRVYGVDACVFFFVPSVLQASHQLNFAKSAAVARVVAFGSLNCTLQIKIFCVFINCATKLQYKYQ